MKIAIVGSGIGGLASASFLQHKHDVVLYEAADNLGGHVHTVEASVRGKQVSVDTGFIVYNERNYPGFSSLIGELGVETRPTTMSFSVSCAATGLEYAGHDLNSLFAQRRNAVNPKFVRMVSDIVRFNRRAREDLAEADWDLSIGEYLDRARFRGLFRTHYLMPMAAAIWSAPVETMAMMPARLFIDFFHNHGLLSLDDRPRWRTLVGGSRSYVRALAARLDADVRTSCPVEHVTRSRDAVFVNAGGESRRFDHVIFACHSDQALRALVEPSAAEVEILGALPFERNEVVLHTDVSLLPRSSRAWAAWNYSLDGLPERNARVTYNMNLLQGLECDETLCVTLNDTDRIDDGKILGQFVYDHPIYTAQSQAARERRWEISGVDRTWYVGAYWGCGFHEDGYQSACDVAERIDSRDLEAAA